MDLLKLRFLVVSATFPFVSRLEKSPFGSKKLKADAKSRYPMILALINDPVLIGKSKREIERLPTQEKI